MHQRNRQANIKLQHMIKNITPTIKYIGVDDTTLDLFESQYIIPNGISYNSYLILDEKVAVMDTVDRRKSEDWWANLEEALEGRTPNYLIVQHMEPDHAGNIVAALEKYPELKVVASKKAIAMLPQFFEGFDFTGRTIAVNEYEKLSLGAHSLQFIMAPMVHWPEVMVTYDHADKILFSADAFGKFGALCHDEEWDCEARRYYINICGKYGISVQSLLKKASELEIKSICPLHGPVLSENLEHYIGLYESLNKDWQKRAERFFASEPVYISTQTLKRLLALTEQVRLEFEQGTGLDEVERADVINVCVYFIHALNLKNPKILRLAWYALRNTLQSYPLVQEQMQAISTLLQDVDMWATN